MSTSTGRIFIIEGNIAAGKTTLGPLLESYVRDVLSMHAVFIPEVIHPLALKVFYGDKSLSPVFQNMVIENTLQRMTEAVEAAREGNVVFIDRGFSALRVFALTLQDYIDPELMKKHFQMINELAGLLPAPYAGIYLDVPSDVCLERIKLRGRKCENTVTLEYLEQLKRNYEEVIFSPMTLPERPKLGYMKIANTSFSGAEDIMNQFANFITLHEDEK